MIKLETAHIEEVRGIRKLDIDFQKGTFAISGPNGSGKSGVIDAIEFGLTGAYTILIGGAAATLDALRQATRLLAGGRCRRALVLAVETFAECEALWTRARWLAGRPLVESAACALLVPADADTPLSPAPGRSALETLARARAGETLACAPLVGLALARAAGPAGAVTLSGEWRGRRAALAIQAH